MKLSCDVIQDLLPLYHDGVCSEESRKIVEEHIATCAACKDVLHGLKEDMAPDAVEAAQPLVSIEMKWNSQKRKALLKGVLIGTLILAVLLGGYWGLTQWHGIPIESENLRVVEVTQVEEGVIYCELGLWDDTDGFGYFEYTLTEDGKLYMTPMRSIITKADRWNDLGFYRNVNNLWGLQGIEHGSSMTGFYFGTPEDHLVIWEEGMELPPANGYVAEEWWQRERILDEAMGEWTRQRKMMTEEELEQEQKELEEKLGELQDQYQATVNKGTE